MFHDFLAVCAIIQWGFQLSSAMCLRCLVCKREVFQDSCEVTYCLYVRVKATRDCQVSETGRRLLEVPAGNQICTSILLQLEHVPPL